MRKNIVLGSPEPTGLEGERIEKCGKCKCNVYVSEDNYPFKPDGYICPNCAGKIKNPEFDVSDESVKRFGMSKKELIGIAKDSIESKKYDRIAS